ncbi:polysaccharide deacetylase family protein [Paenibacillus sp. TAB 01]|uniref:polysaccharide deacetylase family protein n=1 Tax=Paenibacillus sp. TAB 01 TaxID=3368988 RepID=UPI003752512F
MNTKPVWLLSAALLLSAAACQHTNPSASAPPAASAGSSQAGPAAAHTPGEGKESAHADDTSASGAAGAGTNPAQASEQAKPDVPAAEKDKAAPPKQTAKLYKLNPKSYDIVPIDSNTASKQVVLLTFDDGPKDHDMLESILTTLDKHKAKAIFFVNGYRVKQKPELLKLIFGPWPDDRQSFVGPHRSKKGKQGKSSAAN